MRFFVSKKIHQNGTELSDEQKGFAISLVEKSLISIAIIFVTTAIAKLLPQRRRSSKPTPKPKVKQP